ncbi:hypothetical protein HDV02_002228 [Globomyces sp. JEL0801]|nr:hypothetical protein HDV02_002228 [Globomyces sp. JEL0801]
MPTYPPACNGNPTFPDTKLCVERNWDLGANAVDPCAPIGETYPVAGEQVYLQDPVNFCLLLPNPNSPLLKDLFYSKGLLPKIVQAEGYVQSYCMGDYKTPGALSMAEFGIRSAYVTHDIKNGKEYYQIEGRMDCGRLGVNCTHPPGIYDDGGQYDAVSYRYCGKEPYSGVDTRKQGSKFVEYVEQAGNGLYCMRICEKGQQLTDPCNVKSDELGCEVTMGATFPEGFTLNDRITGEKKTWSVALPPLTTTASTAPSGTSNATPTSTKSAAVSDGALSWFLDLVLPIFGLLAL